MKWLALVVLLAACGDNSDECGPGTKAVFDVCMPVGSGGEAPSCGAGTMFDTASDSCVPANGICGDGTVLVAGTCQDPDAGLTVDLEEGPEPNGFAPGSAPAGTIELPASGAFVIHGCIQPIGNAADVDNYLITVAGPTLVDVTVAGTGGMVGGFIAEDAASGFVRYGIATTSATTARDVFFPAAGTYSIAIADARTLLGAIAGEGAIAAGDATSCYYASVQGATTAPVLAPQNTPVSVALSGALQFYEASPGTLPNGLAHAAWTSESANALAAVQVLDDGALRAGATFGGVGSDDVIIVGDFVYDLDATATTFDFELTTASAPALPSDGQAVDLTNSIDPAHASQLVIAGAANTRFSLALDLTAGMQGAVVDSDGNVVADVGGLENAQFTSFHGIVGLAGRTPYYLELYSPPITTGFEITLTSTSVPTAETALALGTPGGALDASGSLAALTSAPWITAGAIGTSTGAVALAIFDDASAVGRLTPIELTTGTSPGVTPLAAPAALAPDDSSPDELALISAAPTLVIATPLAPTSGAALALDLETETYMSISSPFGGTTAVQTLGPGDELRCLVSTPPGTRLSVFGVAEDESFQPVAVLPVDVATHATPEDGVISVRQSALGATAFAVFGPTSGHEVVQAGAEAIASLAYTASPTSIAFVDACATGADVTPRDAIGRVQPGAAQLAVPVGLTFFGAALSSLWVSTDGYLALADPSGIATPTLTTAGVNIAAFAQHLDGARVCMQISNGALVVEWLTATVQVETVIDSTGAIAFVFGPDQRDFGTGAVQGVQSSDGTQVIATGQGSMRPFAFASTGIVLAP